MHLAVYLDISILMDIVVINVPDAWGVFLSRNWSAKLGGIIEMDPSYATIPIIDNTFARLNREL